MRISWRMGSRNLLVLALLATGILLGGQELGVAQSPQTVVPDGWQTLPPNQPGYPVALNGGYLIWGSSPTLADLDGNGTLEVIIAGPDLAGGQPGCGGMVYAYRHNGTPFWQTHVRAAINSTPSVADITGDGHPDVIVSMGGLVHTPECWHGGVIALNGLTGQVLWTFDTQDWLNHVHDGWLDGVFSTPAIGDINGDGQLEIAFGAWDQCLYLLNRNGQPLWGNLPGLLGEIYCGGHGFYNEDVFWSSPALADVTGDGRLEIITGADISPGNWWQDPGGGYLYIFDADGNTLAREWMDQVIYSSPAVADLDKDGKYEFVVGTGTYWSNKGYYVSAFDYNPAATDVRDRLVLKWRKATAGRVFPSPAIADLNKDGWLDVVITVPTGESGADGTLIYAWRGSDGANLFQRRACDMWGNSGNTLSSPTVADIDGDSWPEILFSHMWEVSILNHNGTYYTDYSNPQYSGSPQHPACARDHAPTTTLSYWARYSLYASPAVGDLDGDGDTEVVIGGHNPDNPNQGMLFAWTGNAKEPRPAWPTWRHDERHTGTLTIETNPPTNPTSLSSPSHTPSVWSTSNQVQMTWSGAQDPEGDLAGYSIVWDTSPTTLPDRIKDLDANAQSTTSPPLPDGNSHYFHLRTGDQAGNWTAAALHAGPFWIDSEPPNSRASSPALASGPFNVTWRGHDSGSGIRYYTIQVRDNNGSWTNWLANTVQTSATYQGTVGHTYRFRSIAQDQVSRTETAYTSVGDTNTLVAAHLVSGSILEPRGRPIPAARVTANPPALNEAVTPGNGHYTLGLPAGGSYDLTPSHPGFAALPPMLDLAVDRNLAGIDFYLPPLPNLLASGDFEVSGGWEIGGTVPPTPVSGMGHTGSYALRFATGTGLSSDVSQSSDPEPQSITALIGTITQVVSLPSDARELTLAWLWRVEGVVRAGDTLAVTVQGATATLSRSLPLASMNWTHDWLDVTPLAGQEVTVRFALSRTATSGSPILWLDEVALGRTTPFLNHLPRMQTSN